MTTRLLEGKIQQQAVSKCSPIEEKAAAQDGNPLNAVIGLAMQSHDHGLETMVSALRLGYPDARTKSSEPGQATAKPITRIDHEGVSISLKR